MLARVLEAAEQQQRKLLEKEMEVSLEIKHCGEVMAKWKHGKIQE